MQRSSLDRRAEPGVAAVRDASTTGSLTWTWRRSAGTVLYVGASGRRSEGECEKTAKDGWMKESHADGS